MNIDIVHQKIFEIRGIKVMLDFDLALLYEVETKVLNQTVKRNLKRFPTDFMFQIDKQEFTLLRSQIVTSKGKGGTRYLPYAFTEQGVAMLSGILNSEKAINVNIAIMRTFVYIRRYALSHAELTKKLEELDNKNNKQFDDVFEAINYLLKKDNLNKQKAERPKIGYKKSN